LDKSASRAAGKTLKQPGWQIRSYTI
jgi:hypothetical protein